MAPNQFSDNPYQSPGDPIVKAELVRNPRRKFWWYIGCLVVAGVSLLLIEDTFPLPLFVVPACAAVAFAIRVLELLERRH